jgi:DNA-binding transcriptional LysR family regulator
MIAAGVSILPRQTVEKEAGIRTLSVVPLAIADLVRPVGIIHRRQKPPTPAVTRFIQLLREASDPSAAGAGVIRSAGPGTESPAAGAGRDSGRGGAR